MTANNETTGKRLAECLKLRNMSQRDLIRKVKEKTEADGHPLELDPAHLSKYIKGSLHVPEDKLREIAAVLRIPLGYFTLDDMDDDDDFQCESYADYLEKKMLEANTEIIKYNRLLKPAGIIVWGYIDSYINGIPQSYGYTVTCTSNDGKEQYTLRFDDQEMEAFYQNLCKRLKLEALDLISDYDQSHFAGKKLDKKQLRIKSRLGGRQQKPKEKEKQDEKEQRPYRDTQDNLP